jgi:hypothetical protein
MAINILIVSVYARCIILLTDTSFVIQTDVSVTCHEEETSVDRDLYPSGMTYYKSWT